MARRLPKLCHHKGTGRGYSTDPYTGLEVYHGTWGTPECQQAYEAWIGQLVGRRQEVASGAPAGTRIGIYQLIDDYLIWARSYYVKHGKATSEVNTICQVAAVVNDLFGATRADDFSPTRFKAVRQALVDRGLARDHVNKQMGRIRRIWRWGVERELVQAATLQGIVAVAPLARGRTTAPETDPIEPVPLEVVGATVFYADGQLGTLIRLQRLGCMRAEEVVLLRPCDVDTAIQPWLYVPWTHKTEHRDRQRRIWLGPAAQEILSCWLDGPPDAWLFPGRGRKPGPLSVATYRRRLARCCLRHGLPHWYPLQLRHTALTQVRQRYGLEAAQVAGGHANAEVTEIYAQRDEELARKIARETG